ncbi:2-carboxy-1,4-naphthoquinone phytyltransferase [Hyella patelloides LEGE 07179]|uniref:2-carboxy-1,4-naphthoquinone phytyltransferase n=1 Tax=Hyella patelloides LEGE 07179 TaxID=945734 RepID=A0A563VNK9_9CYAN|nr:2-carboxy-1,4-naphthoquinone phytyltransferase [Hyella patelloides]VEP13011.1 2-carboxy-1,4-naphthoquinone phytyltransferase [Hyella patelloides LEGE 07179]
MTTNQVKSENLNISSRKLWLAAIKPPIYSVAVIPILAGTAVAFAETRNFTPNICFTFLGSAILIIAWLNLSNDVFDADTGIDVNKAHSVVNLTGNQSLIFWLSNLCLLLGFCGIALICWWQKDWMVFNLILLCCALGYSYQGPPFRFGYLGLGEIICFFTFGPGAVSAAYYSQTHNFSLACWAVATLIGISTSIILFCSHFHQVEDDLAAGKRSPIVRLGTARGAKVLAILTISIYLGTTILSILGYLPQTTWLIFASLPIAFQLVNHVAQYHDSPQKVSNSKFIAVNLYLVSSTLLITGLVIS